MVSLSGYFIVALGLFLLAQQECLAAVTREQMAQTTKLMRDVCFPKFKITVEQADLIKTGVFPTDKDGKCYVNCVMEMMQAIKKGKFLYESSVKQVDLLLPDEMKPAYKAGLEQCRTAITTKNNCDAAMELLNCFKANIADFAFP